MSIVSNLPPEAVHANSLINNTFSLEQTENSIKSAIENSFHYLERIQKAYIDIQKFTLTNDDLRLDSIGRKILFTVPKDFIDPRNRREYKKSEFYQKDICLEDILSNKNIFSYFPLVLVDNQSIFSFTVNAGIDGKSYFALLNVEEPINFLMENHTVEITFFRTVDLISFTTNKYVLENYNWALPNSVTGIQYTNGTTPIVFLKDTTETFGTNMFSVSLTENNELLLNQNQRMVDYFQNHREVVVYLLSSKNLYKAEENLQIKPKVNNDGLSAICILESDDNKTFSMPIPVNNILVIKHNKETDEMDYDTLNDITLHYPNIYEIHSDDLDPNIYDYTVYYFYAPMQEKLKFKNIFRNIFKLFMNKMNMSYKEMIDAFIFTECENEKYQSFFFNTIFNHNEPDYYYNHGDFEIEEKPYDLEYKVMKLQTLIENDPNILREYGKKVSMPYMNYIMYTKNVILNSRLRENSNDEATNSIHKKEFDEPHYVFAFRNESSDDLRIRIFVDGILITNYYQFNEYNMDYIYIPTKLITDDSVIEIEKFNHFIYNSTHIFQNSDDECLINIKPSENMYPTICDLFILDQDGDKINNDSFNFWTPVDRTMFDINDNSDEHMNILFNIGLISIDTETNQYYANISLISEFMKVCKSGDYLEKLSEIIGDESDLAELGESTLAGLVTDIYNLFNGLRFIIDNDSRMMHVEKGNDPNFDTLFPEIDDYLLKYFPLENIRIHCVNDAYYNQELKICIYKMPYMYSVTLEEEGFPRIRLFNGEVQWRELNSYVRTFVNGRYIPMKFSIYSLSPTESYFVPRCYIPAGDTLTVDITPYSYELEYTVSVVPENFIISFKGNLSKPFDLKYYDIYLNGRKLNEHHVETITPDKIKLFNVHSRNKLIVFRRDRDSEFYGFTTETITPNDEILNSSDYTDIEKEELIKIIINEIRNDYNEMKPGDDTEEKHNPLVPVDDENFDLYRFYTDIIQSQDVIHPDTFSLERRIVTDAYPTVNQYYVNNDAIIIDPDVNYNANTIFIVGHDDGSDYKIDVVGYNIEDIDINS